MSSYKKLVIVGSGMVGCAAAWHFAKLGWQDVLVIDKGELYENDGSTSHAPGGLVALSHSKLLTQMALYSADLYGSLDDFSPNRNTFNGVGGAEIAISKARWQDLIRLAGEAKAYGVEAYLMSPAEFKREKLPLIDDTQFAGALFVPKWSIVAGAHVSGALARDAMLMSQGGVTFLSHTAMTDLEIENGRITAVCTNNPNHPRIYCEHVLLCTNIWAPALSEKIGFKLPLLAFEHQYAITEPLAEMAHFDITQKEDEIIWPTIRELDSAMYYRQHWDKMGIGSYWHAPRMVRPRDLGTNAGDTAINPFTPADFEAGWQVAQKLMPTLQGKQFGTAFNGMFAFSVDGYPIIGQASVRGVWAAVASWITHSAGVAKSIAEMMHYGETEWDMRQCTIDRFLPFQLTQSYVDVITKKNYREVYDIIHPRQPLSEPRQLRLSPFYQRFAEQEAEFTVFAGLELANWVGANGRLLKKYNNQIPARSDWGADYWSPLQGVEHLETRHNASLWDLTGLSILEVVGTGALSYVNYLCSNEMDQAVGTIIYTTWLTASGGVKRDLTVARLDKDRYWLFVGDGTRAQDLAWVKQHAPSDGSVYINDISDAYSAIGIFGPNARKILQQTSPNDLRDEAFRYYTGQWLEVGPHPVYAMRISYVGELGWELHVPMDASLSVWDLLWQAGRPFDMIAAGMGAMDSLRIEKGYRLWGSDVYTEYDPYQAGLGWTVKLKKTADFIGKDACIQLKAQGLKKKLTCLTLDDPQATLMGYEPIFANDTCIGHVTTANYGYSVGKVIAYGYLPTAHSQPNTLLTVEYFGKRYDAIVVKEPLFDPKNKKMKG